MNVYRWARCGRSKRLNHGRRHSGQRWTWGVSASIAVVSWALHRFRQMDTVLSSLKLQGTRRGLLQHGEHLTRQCEHWASVTEVDMGGTVAA